MTTTDPETLFDLGDEAFGRAMRRSLWWTSVAWMVTVGVGSVAWLLVGGLGASDLFPSDSGRTASSAKGDEALVLAVASLLIAYGSLLPLKLGRDERDHGVRVDESELASRRTSSLVAGVLIRLLGTVALFLTCRYHMATSVGIIAAMTIGWYVLLTSIEVFVLARELPRPVGQSPRTSTRLAGDLRP
jgi:hypothetical protein